MDLLEVGIDNGLVTVFVRRVRCFLAGGRKVFATVAFGLSIWFTYLEAFVIHAWCQWCVVSAILCTLIFLAALPELKRLRNTEEA